MLDWPYCQIYCQKRGGEGIPGDGEPHVFSNLLISICVYVGSNPTLSATRDINSVRPGSVDRSSNEAGITPARAAPKGRGAAE
jgi:hypothetical protein